jgi:histidyl-tRNA synthetase
MKISKIKLIMTLLIFFFGTSFIPQVIAQTCGFTNYLLDITAQYDKSNNSIKVSIANPKPLKSDGKDINLSEAKITVYQGKDVITEKNIGSFTLKPTEKKEITIDNLTDDFGKDVVSVVVSGQTTATPKLEIGSFNIGLSKSITTGVACGDDVLSF